MLIDVSMPLYKTNIPNDDPFLKSVHFQAGLFQYISFDQIGDGLNKIIVYKSLLQAY